MFLKIYGTPYCPYCVRAKHLAQSLKESRNDFDYTYIDLEQEGLTMEDLEKMAGTPVRTVPQIFLDDRHIGGCDDFVAYSNEHLL